MKILAVGDGNTGRKIVEMLMQHQRDFNEKEREQHYNVLLKESKLKGTKRFDNL